MPSHTTEFFTAALIARASGCSKITIQRRAAREGWTFRRRGNRFEYALPAELGEVCAVRFPAQKPADYSRLRRECFRASVVLFILNLREEQPALSESTLINSAFLQFCLEPIASKSSIRRWLHAAQRDGLPGLVERKLGRSGKRKVVAL